MSREDAATYEEIVAGFDADGFEAIRDGLRAHPREERLAFALRAFNQRDIEFLVGLRTEDSVHDMTPTEIPGMGRYDGREGYRHFVMEWLEAFPEAELKDIQVETADAPNGEWCWHFVTRQRMSGAGSGVPIEFTVAGVGLTGADDLVRWTVFDTDVPRSRERFAQVNEGSLVP